MELEFLVKKAQKGNEEAFIKLIEMHKKLMYSVAKSMVDNDEDIADLIQETILKSYKNIRNLKDSGGFKAWLMRILINNCNDFIKNSKKVVSIDEVAMQSSKCEEFEQIELKEIFNSLDGSLRLIVQLYYIEDISVKDIAKLINIPEGTVKSRLHRARRILNELFIDRRTSYAGNAK